MTSYALSGDDAKAFAAGCDAYVTKPFDPADLLEKIKGYLWIFDFRFWIGGKDFSRKGAKTPSSENWLMNFVSVIS